MSARLLRLPRRTIRLRLALLYGSVFLLAGVLLLTITYLLVARQYRGGLFAHAVGPRSVAVFPAPVGARPAFGPVEARAVSSVALTALFKQSLVALAVAAVLSVWLGWILAGRALRPLREITDAARDISARDLHRRLAVEGPDDELSQLGRTFNGLLARLEGAFEAQRRFVANASHELRTPLTLQRTLVQVALADPDASAASLRELGEEVLAAGERQERLIDALLTLSRSQTGLERSEPVDLAAVAASALRDLDVQGLRLETALAPAATRGDPGLVERLVANLLDNAVRHNVAGGRLAVETRLPGGRALLAVENTGPPVPPGELPRLFQPFQRLERARTGEGGLGLGLSIVDAIASAHGATVATQALAGGGLRVEVAFPPSG